MVLTPIKAVKMNVKHNLTKDWRVLKNKFNILLKNYVTSHLYLSKCNTISNWIIICATYVKKEVTIKETVLKSDSDQIAKCLLVIPILYEEGCRYKRDWPVNRDSFMCFLYFSTSHYGDVTLVTDSTNPQRPEKVSVVCEVLNRKLHLCMEMLYKWQNLWTLRDLIRPGFWGVRGSE